MYSVLSNDLEMERSFSEIMVYTLLLVHISFGSCVANSGKCLSYFLENVVAIISKSERDIVIRLCTCIKMGSIPLNMRMHMSL